MNDPTESAGVAIAVWAFLTVAYVAVPTIIIVMAVHGVRDEIRRLVEALKDLDREDGVPEPID